jgi:hypothetical protein
MPVKERRQYQRSISMQSLQDSGLVGEIVFLASPALNPDKALEDYLKKRRASGQGFDLREMEQLTGFAPGTINQRIQDFLRPYDGRQFNQIAKQALLIEGQVLPGIEITPAHETFTYPGKIEVDRSKPLVEVEDNDGDTDA